MPEIGRTNPFAKQLRRNATEAEKKLWNCVRNRQLGGWKFRRQVTIGPYIADFACPEAKLVVELDGGQHVREDDTIRAAFLETRGFRVLRFWNNDVLANIEGVCSVILESCLKEGPSPNPLPHAGEGSEAGPPPLQGGL